MLDLLNIFILIMKMNILPNFFYLIIIMNNLTEFSVFILVFVSFFIILGASIEYFISKQFTQLSQLPQIPQIPQKQQIIQIKEKPIIVKQEVNNKVEDYIIPISDTLDFENEPIINSEINTNFDAEKFLGYVFFQFPQPAIGPYPSS